MEGNRFNQQIMFRGRMMNAAEVIELRKKEMEVNNVAPATEEQFEAKKEEVNVPEEVKEETEMEQKIKLRKLLKSAWVKFFPWACVNTLKDICEKNSIVY